MHKIKWFMIEYANDDAGVKADPPHPFQVMDVQEAFHSGFISIGKTLEGDKCTGARMRKNWTLETDCWEIKEMMMRLGCWGWGWREEEKFTEKIRKL